MDVALVINPQKTWLDPSGALYMGEKGDILKVRIQSYLSGFSGKTIFVREKHAIEDTFFVTEKTHSIATSGEFHIADELKPYSKDVIDKIRYSSFFGTNLENELIRAKATTVKLLGVETHTSVLFTAEGLRNRGYDVTLIEPCTMARDEYFHGCAVAIMASFLGVHIGA